ncbi:MAG TPA: ATP-binding protein [Saprospiraceae bacterium]|nr:ATP-binding protein [Saprospiraceae bacterium]
MSNFKVNVIGAESTGKSTLCTYLAEEFGLTLIPEYARDYCSTIGRKIGVEDVIHIGNQQIQQYNNSILNVEHDRFIFDTSIITSMIWLNDKFRTANLSFHDFFLKERFNVTLLCFPDIGWEEDILREDKGRQLEIHEQYIHYLDSNNKKYHLILGQGQKRNILAKKILDSYI